jgi:DNA-binding CsgD family transcriptional regulator
MDDGRLLRCGLRAARTLTTNEPFERELAETLRGTVGADCVAVNVWRDWRHRAPSLTIAGEPNVLPVAEIDTWIRRFADHPYFVNLLATGDPEAHRTSDFMPFHSFQDTLVYRDLLAHYGLRHQLIMTLRYTDLDLVFVSLLRGLHDFSDREAGALEPVRGLLSAALTYHSRVQAIQSKIRPDMVPGCMNGLRLTERENQVLALVATGCTNDQAAHRLGISTRTIRKHLESVFAKAHVPSRTAAVTWWLRQPARP